MRGILENGHLQFRRAALILLLFIIASAAFGQFGLAIDHKAVVGISTFRGSDFDNIHNRTGWLGGVALYEQSIPVLTVQPEVLLTRRGEEFIRINSLNYLEIPVRKWDVGAVVGGGFDIQTQESTWRINSKLIRDKRVNCGHCRSKSGAEINQKVSRVFDGSAFHICINVKY